MISIKCEGCNRHCCGEITRLTPVLLPSEEKRLKRFSRKIETPYRDIFVLAKKDNENCVFFDDKTRKCTVYDQRPLECILYPFLLDFDKTLADVKLDKRFCPHLGILVYTKKNIIALVRRNQFPSNWIEGYKTLEDF